MFIEEDSSESNSEESDIDKDIAESQDGESQNEDSGPEKSSRPASYKTGCQSTRNTGISCKYSTKNAKLKLIRILKGKALIPKQRWGIDKILATLVHH